MSYAEQLIQKNKIKRSRQEMIDRTMCKPGYTWNETLKKCLGYGGGGKNKPIPENPASPDLPDAPTPPSMPDTPNQAIAKEVSARAMQG